MTDTAIKETIRRALPEVMREDPSFRQFVLDLTRDTYADRAQTGDWFHQAIEEMRQDRARSDLRWDEYLRDRAEQTRKWEANQAELKTLREEQNRKWEEQNRKWEANQAELKALREEQTRKWEEQNGKWEEQNTKWKEQNTKWEEQNRKWEANQAELHQMTQAIMAQARKFDRTIGALGSRWGMQSEKAFREALAGILEENFAVDVINYNGYDDQGHVFGRPEQIELDVIIKNGLLILCELKSSIDKGGMYLFERKARFYEREHQRKATRLIVISPMIDAKARKVSETLGIDCYGDSLEVDAL